MPRSLKDGGSNKVGWGRLHLGSAFLSTEPVSSSVNGTVIAACL